MMKKSILFFMLLLSVCGFCRTLTVTSSFFSQTATIRFTLTTADTCSLAIYTRWGNKVRTFFNDTLLQTGNYSYILNGDSLIAHQDYYLVLNYGDSSEYAIVVWENYTALSEVKSTDAFSLYPNPAKDRIVFDAAFIGSEIVVIDVSGRQQTVIIDQNQIDISSLAKGPYIARFKCKGVVAEREFIKE